MSMFWEAISVLEHTCNLSVIAAVSDDASKKTSRYGMHGGYGDHPDANVVYTTCLQKFVCSRKVNLF